MSVLSVLRQNDPIQQNHLLDIDLLYERSSDADLAEALEQNPFVTKVKFFLGDRKLTGWPLLRRAIANHKSLKNVWLTNGGSILGYRPMSRPEPSALMLLFIEAAQSNIAVEEITLIDYQFVPGSEAFTNLCAHLNVPSLILIRCDVVDPLLREQGARALAAATMRNLVIADCDKDFACALLRNLSKSVKTLRVENWNFNTDIPAAIGHLLNITTTIRRLELDFLHSEITGRQLLPIAQGLINSEIVCGFNISRGYLDDEAACLLQDILKTKRNMTFLSLKQVGFMSFRDHTRKRRAICDSINRALLRPDSTFRCFEIESGLFLDDDLLTLLGAVAKSKLIRFKIGFRRYSTSTALLKMIPLLRVKEFELDLGFGGMLDEETIKQSVLDAVKRNFSFRSVEMYFGASPLFSQAEGRQRLAFYLNRNERLEEWVGSPGTMGQEVWPDGLALAQQAGRDALYTSLQSVLGSGYIYTIVERNRRKRKRSNLKDVTT